MAEDNGGALDCGDGAPYVRDCTFINNTGGRGGGVCAQGPAVIENCTFINDSVDHTEYEGYGGGIAILGAGGATVINCSIYDCSSKNKGGAVYVDKDCSAAFINCTMTRNVAADGSGFCLVDAGTVTLINTIITRGGADAAFAGTGTVDISYSNIFGHRKGDWTGPVAGQLGVNGNLSVDPLFVDEENGDLHLTHGSPCCDVGDSGSPGVPVKDVEGDLRDLMDMGADEFHAHLYCLGEASPGLAVETRIIGPPGSDTLLFIGADVIEPPAWTMYGDWHLQMPVTALVTGPIPAIGVITLRQRIPPTCPIPLNLPMQAFLQGGLTNLCTIEVR
jgi:predicted outer membrane repeat protein